MGSAMTWAVGAACLGVLAILTYGILGFGSGKMTPQKQNKIMRLRIIAQAGAVVLILLTVLALRSGE